jgi:hypothetical protein
MAWLRLCRHFAFIGLDRPEIPLGKRRGWRECAALSKAGLFAIRNGARGERGRARGELKTVRPGAATRERFSRVKGKKRFGVTAGRFTGFRSAQAAAAAGAAFRRFLVAR